MGLINKIEDKLSSNKSTDQQYNESSSTGQASHLQHPVSSGTSGPTGTAVSNTSHSSTGQSTSGYDRDGYGSSQSTSDRYPSNTTDQRYGNESSSYGTQQSHSTVPTGHNTTGHSTSGRNEVPGTHGTHSSVDPRNTTSNTNSSSQNYDPYSSKGQSTATSATHGHGLSSSTHGNRAPYEDENVSRSQQGGILNNTTDQHASSGYVNSAPHSSSGQHGLSSSRNEPNSSSHHYGRDAATAGGVGAAGAGAYEYGKHQQGSSHDNARSHETGPMTDIRDGKHMPTGGASGVGSSSHGGHDQAKKMGAAYEAGYRDGMEHMRQEMENARLSR